MNPINDEPFAIISDIHSNWEAMGVVIRDIIEKDIKTIYNLGDTIGYGPNPKECLDAVLSDKMFRENTILGNHDSAFLAPAILDDNWAESAQVAMGWTIKMMENNDKFEDYLRYFRGLKTKITINYNGKEINMCHGSPKRPLIDYVFRDEYERHAMLMEWFDEEFDSAMMLSDQREEFVEGYMASEKASLFELVNGIWFVGHSHSAGITVEDDQYEAKELDNRYRMNGEKAIISVGSVGQSRDIKGVATYTIVEGDNVDFIRLPYDVDTTVDKIIQKEVGTDLKNYTIDDEEVCLLDE